jgi:hypothetical protein
MRGRSWIAAVIVGIVVAGSGVAGARGLPGDPSSGGGGSIAVKSSAKRIGRHGHYTITVSGQLPANGVIYLLWTDAKKVTGGCPRLGTEESFIQAGFGGSLLQAGVPAGPIAEVKPHLGGTAGLKYRFCGYARFITQSGQYELGAGTVVKVK